MSNKHRKLWSEFVSYARDHVRDDDNPGLGVTPNYLPTHKFLLFTLKNVEKGTTKLFRAIEGFRVPGTHLRLTESVDDGPSEYQVRIPLKVASTRKRRSGRHTKSPDKPNVVNLLALGMCLFGIVAGAAVTTTAADWAFIFQ